MVLYEFAVDENRKISFITKSMVGDNYDYYAHFSFPSGWERDVKTVRFIKDEVKVSAVLDDNDLCRIPADVIVNGFLTVGVFSGEKATSRCRVLIDASIRMGDDTPLPPTEDEYRQIIQLIEDGRLKGEKGDKGDPGYTPIKGVDYWTDEDQESIKADLQPYVDQAREEVAKASEEVAKASAEVLKAKAEADRAENVKIDVISESRKAVDNANLAKGYSDTAKTFADSAIEAAKEAKDAGAGIDAKVESAIEEIVSEKDSALALIESAGESAISDIDNERDDAVTIIDEKGEEIISQLPDIEGMKTDVANLKTNVADLNTEVTSQKKDLTQTEKSLDALWKLNKGQTYDIVEQTEEGMNNPPSGALFQTLEEVYGKSEQETTEGYNLWNMSLFASRDGISVDGDTITQTSTSSNVSILSGNIFPQDLYDKTITFWCDPSSTAKIRIKLIDNGSTSYINFTGKKTVNFASYSGLESVTVGFYGTGKGQTIIKPMMILGSDVKPYEPYTGGLPMPNPSFPSEVIGIKQSDGINVSIVSKNRLDRDMVGGWLSCETVGSAYSVGSSTSSVRLESFPVKKGEKYTVSWKHTGNSTSRRGCVADSNKVVLQNFYLYTTYTDEKGYFTFTADYDGFLCYSLPATAENVQIEVGEYSGFAPYHEPISHNISIPFDMYSIGDYKDVMDVENGVWVQKCDSKTITVSIGSGGAGSVSASLFSNIDTTSTTSLMSNKFIADATLTTPYHFRLNGARTSMLFYGDSNETYSDVNVLYKINDKTFPISAEDLEWLRENLTNLSTDDRIILTSGGKDVSYLVEYIIKLSEVG